MKLYLLGKNDHLYFWRLTICNVDKSIMRKYKDEVRGVKKATEERDNVW